MTCFFSVVVVLSVFPCVAVSSLRLGIFVYLLHCLFYPQCLEDGLANSRTDKWGLNDE